MKNTVKLFGIIALVVVIGFSMAACGEKEDDQPTAIFTPWPNDLAYDNNDTPTRFKWVYEKNELDIHNTFPTGATMGILYILYRPSENWQDNFEYQFNLHAVNANSFTVGLGNMSDVQKFTVHYTLAQDKNSITITNWGGLTIPNSQNQAHSMPTGTYIKTPN